MQNIYSMTGASANTETNWVWCIPGSGDSENMPICILVMSAVGPRYLPTRVFAPMRFRKCEAPYVEAQPTIQDTALSEAVLAWEFRRHGPRPTTAAIHKCTQIANNVAAAMRFLDCTGNAFNVGLKQVREDDLYIGRSVNVCVSPSLPLARGWVASDEEPFFVVIQDSVGGFRKITADSSCLIEDGTAEVPRIFL